MNTLIISGGRFDKEFAASWLKTNVYDYVIAVDYGLRYAKELGIMPDLIVGDFDSNGENFIEEYTELGCDVRKCMPDKDDTDTEIAVREAVLRGNPIDIICATGGRIDHMLANIHVLMLALKAGVEARLLDKGNEIFLKNHSFTLTRAKYSRKYVSFVPFDGIVKGIKLKGFKYTLDGYDLKPGISRCISNEFAEDEAYVEFDSGCLIVINSSDVETE